MLSFGWFPGVWILRVYADVSEHTVCLHLHRQVGACRILHAPTCLWRWRQSAPKRRHIKFTRRGITQKKAYNIQDTADVWNQEYILCNTAPSRWPQLWPKHVADIPCIKCNKLLKVYMHLLVSSSYLVDYNVHNKTTLNLLELEFYI